MKNILFFVAALMLYTAANSQNSLTGTIISKNSNEPLLATVYIPQLEKGTTSDFDGNYIVNNIPDGNYNVVYSALGYATVSKKILFTKGKTITKAIQLDESAVEMEEQFKNLKPGDSLRNVRKSLSIYLI